MILRVEEEVSGVGMEVYLFVIDLSSIKLYIFIFGSLKGVYICLLWYGIK